jgi:hypothetical protein
MFVRAPPMARDWRKSLDVRLINYLVYNNNRCTPVFGGDRRPSGSAGRRFGTSLALT